MDKDFHFKSFVCFRFLTAQLSPCKWNESWHCTYGILWFSFGNRSMQQFMLALTRTFEPDHIQWQPTTDQTLYQAVTLLPNSIFYRILIGFHRTFTTCVACRQGTLTPPDTLSRPFGNCICSTCWDQAFSRTCRYVFVLCTLNIPLYVLCFASFEYSM